MQVNKYGQSTPLDPQELKQNVNNGGDDVNHFLSLLFAPTLTLVEHYLMSKNGNKRTKQNCVSNFSEDHPNGWITVFAIDLIWRLISIGLVVIVFARGLGIIKI